MDCALTARSTRVLMDLMTCDILQLLAQVSGRIRSQMQLSSQRAACVSFSHALFGREGKEVVKTKEIGPESGRSKDT